MAEFRNRVKRLALGQFERPGTCTGGARNALRTHLSGARFWVRVWLFATAVGLTFVMRAAVWPRLDGRDVNPRVLVLQMLACWMWATWSRPRSWFSIAASF